MAVNIPNLVLLRNFVAVAEEGGISRAARRLRISQPALSKNLRRLEATLGTALFARHAGGTELTEAGRRFLDHARKIGIEYEHAVQEIHNLISEQEGAIRLGIGPVWASTVAPAAIPRFHARFPRHQLQIQTGNVDDMIEGLRVGRLDIFAGALIRQNQIPGFVRKRVTAAEIGLMCAEDHPLAQIEGPVDPRRIVEYPFVSYPGTDEVLIDLTTFLRNANAPPLRLVTLMSSIYACVELVRTSNYLFFETTMLARGSLGRGLTVLSLPKAPYRFDMGFVFREQLDRLPAYSGVMKAMIDAFTESFSDAAT